MYSSLDFIKNIKQYTPQQIYKQFNVLDRFKHQDAIKLLILFNQQINSQNQSVQKIYAKTKGIHKIYDKLQLRQIAKKKIKNLIKNKKNNSILINQKTLEKLQQESIKQGKTNKNRQSQQKQIQQANMRELYNLSIPQNQQKFIQIVKIEDITCSICLQAFIHPIMTHCGHFFCLFCLQEQLIFSQTCPMCRQCLKYFQPQNCPLLEQIARKKIKTLPLQQKLSYKERIAKYNSWKQLRYINFDDIKINDMLDIKDTENIWCRATVLQLYKNSKSQKIQSILISYDRWHKIYNEVIDIPTSRIAKASYFTKRTDIKRYELSQQQNNVRGTVFRGPPTVPFFHIIELQSDQQVLNANTPQISHLNRQQLIEIQDEDSFYLPFNQNHEQIQILSNDEQNQQSYQSQQNIQQMNHSVMQIRSNRSYNSNSASQIGSEVRSQIESIQQQSIQSQSQNKNYAHIAIFDLIRREQFSRITRLDMVNNLQQINDQSIINYNTASLNQQNKNQQKYFEQLEQQINRDIQMYNRFRKIDNNRQEKHSDLQNQSSNN